MPAGQNHGMRIPARFLRGHGEPLGEFPCPCCRFLTLQEPPPGTYEICAMCGWEDDGVQFEDPDYVGGANGTSLNDWGREFEATLKADNRDYNWPPRA